MNCQGAAQIKDVATQLLNIHNEMVASGNVTARRSQHVFDAIEKMNAQITEADCEEIEKRGHSEVLSNFTNAASSLLNNVAADVKQQNTSASSAECNRLLLTAIRTMKATTKDKKTQLQLTRLSQNSSSLSPEERASQLAAIVDQNPCLELIARRLKDDLKRAMRPSAAHVQPTVPAKQKNQRAQKQQGVEEKQAKKKEVVHVEANKPALPKKEEQKPKNALAVLNSQTKTAEGVSAVLNSQAEAALGALKKQQEDHAKLLDDLVVKLDAGEHLDEEQVQMLVENRAELELGRLQKKKLHALTELYKHSLAVPSGAAVATSISTIASAAAALAVAPKPIKHTSSKPLRPKGPRFEDGDLPPLPAELPSERELPHLIATKIEDKPLEEFVPQRSTKAPLGLDDAAADAVKKIKKKNGGQLPAQLKLVPALSASADSFSPFDQHPLSGLVTPQHEKYTISNEK